MNLELSISHSFCNSTSVWCFYGGGAYISGHKSLEATLYVGVHCFPSVCPCDLMEIGGRMWSLVFCVRSSRRWKTFFNVIRRSHEETTRSLRTKCPRRRHLLWAPLRDFGRQIRNEREHN